MAISPQRPELTDTENAVIEDLAIRLGAEVAEELTEGGSPARLVRVVSTNGASTVIKLLVDIPGIVDGHDLESFRVKIHQIEKIRDEIPSLAPTYTELSQQFHGPDWAAYTMPFYSSRDIAEPLRRGIAPADAFLPELGRILTDLIGHGYLRDSVPTGPGTVATVHCERLLRRFWLLRTYLPSELTDAERIVVNGRECRNPLALAYSVIADSALTNPIDPTQLYYPVHGDLNTRNILITDADALRCGDGGGYRIIDPRGTMAYWDSIYDISKILFSLTVWDPGMRKGFIVDNDHSRGWTVAIRGGNYPQYLCAARDLLGFLYTVSGFDALIAADPDWESRYLLGHAFHLLGEAACRLSGVKRQTTEDSAHRHDPLELATGHYLYGVLFLDEAVTQLNTAGSITHDTTLSLLVE